MNPQASTQYGVKRSPIGRMGPVFDAAYSNKGRPGVPPERLLKALLLMAIYSVRSERQLIERIDTDLLFRWFLDLSPEEPVFDSTAFAHNRPRMDEHNITATFFGAVVSLAIDADLCGDDHFGVDGADRKHGVDEEFPAETGAIGSRQ